MVVQTFGKRILDGKRILGGIGAPGGGMSEAYGAGVTTALGQRETRQVMGARDQEMAWKAEDRAEAKRAREAAAAAAAAARARNAAMGRELAAGLRTAPPSVAVPPGQDYGPALTPGRVDNLMPPPAGAPAPGTPVGPRPGLSFGAMGGAAVGPQAAVAPEQFDPSQLSNIQFLQGGLPATPDVSGPLPSYVEAPGLRSSILGDMPGAANADQLFQEGLINEFEYRQLVRGSRDQQSAVLANVAGRRLGQDIPFFTPETAPAAAAAPTAPATTAEATLPTGESATLSMGRMTEAPATPPLTFGERLGAVPDPSMTVVDRVMANPAAQPQAAPDAQMYLMEPGRPNRELQLALSAREELVRQAEIFSRYGEYRSVAEIATKVAELDNNLFYLQGMQALQELAFNSPQRLSMILGQQFGRDIGIQPNQMGTFDVYVDGMLWQQMPRDTLSMWARGQLDSEFAAAEAARAATYAEEQMRSDIQEEREGRLEILRSQLSEAEAIAAEQRDVDAALLEARLNPANVDMREDPNTGDVLVFDKASRTMLGTITRTDPFNPGQVFPVPTFIPSQ